MKTGESSFLACWAVSPPVEDFSIKICGVLLGKKPLKAFAAAGGVFSMKL